MICTHLMAMPIRQKPMQNKIKTPQRADVHAGRNWPVYASNGERNTKQKTEDAVNDKK
jgi:hypothetical protein